MAIPWTPKVYAQLNGGMNTTSAPPYIADNQFGGLINMQLDASGALVVRNGYVDTGVVENTYKVGTGLFQFMPDGAASQILKTATDNPFTTAVLAKRTGSTWTVISPSAFTFANHSHCTFVQYANAVRIFAFGGANSILKYDGTTFSAVSGSPNAQFGVVFYGRIFAAGDPANPSVLYFSDGTSVDNWTTGTSGNIQVAPGDGDTITGLVALFNRLIVFKRFSVYVVDGTDLTSFTLQKVVGEYGCVSDRSILTIGNKAIYLSDKGFYETDGSTTAPISDLIRPTRTGLNISRDAQSFAIHHRKRSQYVCFASDGGSALNNVALAYQYGTPTVNYQSISQQYQSIEGAPGGWSKFTDFSFQAGAVVVQSNKDYDIYLLDGANGKLWIYERNEAGRTTVLDNGAGYPFSALTKWMDQDQPHQSKFWREIVFVMGATGTVVSYSKAVRIGVPTSNYLQMNITGNTGGANFTIQLFTDFDPTTVQQSITLAPPASNSPSGVQKFIVYAQLVGDRIARNVNA